MGSGSREFQSANITQEGSGKIQNVADSFSDNVWLMTTRVLLTIALTTQTISEERYWTEVHEAHSPLLGNGPKKISNDGELVKDNCLYITFILDTTKYNRISNVDLETQILRKGEVIHFKQIVQYLYTPSSSSAFC